MYGGDCQVLTGASSMAENNASSTATAAAIAATMADHGSTSSIFSITNPNSGTNYNSATGGFNFMTTANSLPSSFHPFPPLFPSVGGVKEERGKEEMNMESMSGGSELNIEGHNAADLDTLTGGGDGGSGAGTAFLLPQQPPSKKKPRYHRHTAHQIQQMEAMFRECPHPDDKQRMKLSQELGLKPRQVKFWFQNRRTQMKAQQDRTENVILRAENDNLKNENYRLEAMLKSLFCPSCGGGSILGEVEYDEQQLRLENARLKEELDRVCNIAARCNVRSLHSLGPPSLPPSVLLPPQPPSLELDMNIYSRHFQDQIVGPCNDMIPMHPMLPNTSHYPTNDLISDDERPLAMELAMSSMDELIKMCHVNEPLWARSDHNNGSMDVLNVEEYSRMFSWQNCNETRIEGTRDTAVVIMNSINLVEAFLDANKWMELFPSIVSRAKTLQIVSSGVSGHPSGSLHLMYAELQVLSPLVPTREIHFLRYCHQNTEEGTWAIVDFPVDNFHGRLQLSHGVARYRRRPSGCIIQDMPNGYSKVTWVEHGEILDEKPAHQIFQQYVHSKMAFGAKRWVAVLQRQCERFASLMARNISDLGAVIQSLEARKNMMKLSERMVRAFCVNMSTSGGQSWTALSESPEDTVRITTRRITEAGQPSGLILSAVSTISLQFSHQHVFDFLKNERRRSQIEALSNGSSLHEVAHIANGSHPGNCISLFRINAGSNSSSHNVELMLQESCTDASGSLVVFATMEVDYIHLMMSSDDPSTIPLLPLGFSILPSASAAAAPTATSAGGGSSPSCLLTMAVQAHASPNPNAKLSLSTVSAVNSHISAVLSKITAALVGTHGGCTATAAASSASK